MHSVSCMHFLPCLLQKKEEEWHTAQRKTGLSVLSNSFLTQPQHEHQQALSFLTYEEKRRRDWGTGKARQRVNTWIRHMLRAHSAYTNPTCTLRAPFRSHTFHLSFDLCKAKDVNTRSPNEHNGENPSVPSKQPPRAQYMRVT